jgi:hypothetical protein
MTYNRGRKRLGAIKKVLEDAFNWREVDSTLHWTSNSSLELTTLKGSFYQGFKTCTLRTTTID